MITKANASKLNNSICTSKTGNTSYNFLHKIRQIVYSLYWAKEVAKAVYNNINQYRYYKMDTILMNSKSSKTSNLHILFFSRTDSRTE